MKGKRVFIGICVCMLFVFIFLYFRHVDKKQSLATMHVKVQDTLEYGSKISEKEIILELDGTLKEVVLPDTKKLGKQNVYITLQKNGYEKKLCRQVEIVDTSAPCITLKKTKVTTAYGKKIALKDNVKQVKDAVDGNLPFKQTSNRKQKGAAYYTIKEAVQWQKKGTYTIQVIAIDRHGNKATKQFSLHIKEKPKVKNRNTSNTKEGQKANKDKQAHSMTIGKALTIPWNTLQRDLQKQLPQQGDWSFYLLHIATDRKLTSHVQTMPAASLIKLYIMGAVYEQYDAIVKQNGSDYVQQLLTQMITVSDNDAANTLTAMLGKGDKAKGRFIVNQYCQNHGYRNTKMQRMLLGSAKYGDNETSVADCGLFLQRVYQGSIPHANAMLKLLMAQQRTAKIPAGVPAQVSTANKTGELADVENDAAIILAGKDAYIFVIMADHLQDCAAARSAITQLSSRVYQAMVMKY